VVWDARTRQFYGIEERASILFRFDPRTHEVERPGQLAIPAMAARRDVPCATLALPLGRDRKLYYGADGIIYMGGAIEVKPGAGGLSEGRHPRHQRPGGRRGWPPLHRRPAVGLDGTVYIGQAERKSKLYLYCPEDSR
jgi:hypothetical protein